MVVVSAGVFMNIILAAIGFMVVFLIGFRVQPAVVGSVTPGSPAQHATLVNGTPAPLRPGDRILYYDGKYQHDFTKITLNVALSGAGKIPMYVQRTNGERQHLLVVPKASDLQGNFLALGIGRPEELRAVDQEDAPALNEMNGPDSMLPPESLLLKPGDVITAVNGQPVKVNEYWKFNRALQASNGNPVKLTVKHADGSTATVSVRPHFAMPFGGESLSFAGMIPRTTVAAVEPTSPARGKLLPGDVILQISYAHGADPLVNPTASDLMDRLNKAGANGQAVDMKVLRDGKTRDITGLTPNSKVAPDRYGLHIALGYDDRHAVVAGIEDKTAAAAAGIPTGAEITAIDDQPVNTWFDVKRLLESVKPNTPVKLAATTVTGKQAFNLVLEPHAITRIADYNFVTNLPLDERIEPRKTDNPIVAAAWGISETRDFILQFYVTLQRMFQGRVSYQNMMGPVGIFNAGRHFAVKGADWLLWFLSMISADLAVVNFLPIPIVDGGLFLFLIIEKIQGRPLSPKTQSIAQVIGLAIIVGVFLLVTYNDVTRNLIR
jgi:regulator of sigma E protease